MTEQEQEQDLLKRFSADGWELDSEAGVFRRGERDSTISVKRAMSGRYAARLPTNQRRKRQRLQKARRERRQAQ